MTRQTGGIIAAIVVLSVGLGFVNEYRSEVAVAALHANIRHEALAWRDGTAERIDVASLVPGDVVTLRVGDLVPADVRLIEAVQLECDEAILTGESIAAIKTVEATATDSEVDLPSCAFMGTVVHQGSGRAVVVATGSSTAFGKIAVGLGGEAGRDCVPGRVARVLGTARQGRCRVDDLDLRDQRRGPRPLLEALLFSLAIVIGITPQLLPAIVSVSLSTGSRQLARQRVLVKRLVTIEDLGNIEVLFTDKTGTLTEGAITFDRSLDPAGQPTDDPLGYGLVCNESTRPPPDPSGTRSTTPCGPGQPPPGSCPARIHQPATNASGCSPSTTNANSPPSSSEPPKDEPSWSPKEHQKHCSPDASTSPPRRTPRSASLLFGEGSRGRRGPATRDAYGLTQPTAADERDLSLAGFLTFVDRPKADAGESIAKLNRIGIAGEDHHRRQRHRRQQGLPGHRPRRRSRTHRCRSRCARRRRLAAAIPHTTVFARVSPEQKSRDIVRKIRVRTPVSMSRTWATGSTMLLRCTPQTSASPSNPRPTSPRTQPTSCSSTKTSACSPTESWKVGGSSPTPSSTS